MPLAPHISLPQHACAAEAAAAVMSRQAPLAVIDDALRQFESTGEEALPAFVHSKLFAGARPGYYFSSGPKGVG